MARGVNKAIIVGNLGRDPEMRYFQDGTPVANFSVATTESWNDKVTGEKREKTEWHRIVAFRKLAEICGQYLTKGRQVYIEGKIQTKEWEDKEGVKRYTTEIVANNMQMLGSRQDSGYQGGGGYGPQGGGGFQGGQNAGGGFQGGGYGSGPQGGGYQGGGGFQGGGYGPGPGGQQGGGYQGGPNAGGGFQGGGQAPGPGFQGGGGYQQTPRQPAYEAPQQGGDAYPGDYQPEQAAPSPGIGGDSPATPEKTPSAPAQPEQKTDTYDPPAETAPKKEDVSNSETDDDIPF